MLLEGAGHLDPNGVPAPWLKLLTYENNTDCLSNEVANLTNAVQRLQNFDEEIIEKVTVYH